MLHEVMSHWAMRFYLPYVVVLLVLFFVFRHKTIVIYRRIRMLPAQTRRILAARWRPRWGGASATPMRRSPR